MSLPSFILFDAYQPKDLLLAAKLAPFFLSYAKPRMNTDTPASAVTMRRDDGPCQCYTSYPTPDRFDSGFTSAHLAQALAQRRTGLTARALPLSLGVNLFHDSAIGSCASKAPGLSELAERYVRYLSREVELLADAMGRVQTFSHLYLNARSQWRWTAQQVGALMAVLGRRFQMVPGGEYTIELCAHSVDPDSLGPLAQLGFNRLRLDMHPGGQDVQADSGLRMEQVLATIPAARQHGFESVQLDLRYPLVSQPSAWMQREMHAVCAMQPERIAIDQTAPPLCCAPGTRRHETSASPGPAGFRSMQTWLREQLTRAGYVHVGLHLFALPDDSLAVARRQGRLHRSCLGYGTQPDGDLIGLGVAAKGCVGLTYHQNAPSFQSYAHLIDQARLPTVRGMTLSRDDLLRRSVIMALLCHGEVQFESIELGFLVDFRRYFAREIQDLAALQEEGWVHMDTVGIQVAPLDWSAVRAVARVFDRYLQTDRDRARSSRIH